MNQEECENNLLNIRNRALFPSYRSLQRSKGIEMN